MSKRVKGEDKKQDILDDFLSLFSKLNRTPKMDELVALGHTKDSIKHHFSSLAKLESLAREEHPDAFFDVGISSLLSDTATAQLHSTLKHYKRFIITTAVTGCPVHEGFYKSLQNYCRVNDAALLILTAPDPSNTKSYLDMYGTIDKKLASECIVTEDTYLNSNFFISSIKLSAKQVNPTTGLSDVGQRDGSFVFASPKQSLVVEPSPKGKLPHVIMTTGAITKPHYVTNSYMAERTSYIADKHHVMGGVVVTIHDDETYAYTQIQTMNKAGSFVHLGKRYHPNGKVTKDTPEALVCGDWHSGATDPDVRACTEEMLRLFKPKYVVLHDVFDGLSINPHEEGHTILKARRFIQGTNKSIEEEVSELRDDLTWFSKLVKEVVIVKSNHDEFLANNYLKLAKYAQDPQNHYFSLDLAKAMMEGKDPLKFATEKVGLKATNIRWLKRDEDFKIAGIQLGAHGDIGLSGAKGNIKAMRKAYGLSVTGHTHSPRILHGAYSVGTSSKLHLGYNRGPDGWLQTHCLVYKDGSRQLINMIDGKWEF